MINSLTKDSHTYASLSQTSKMNATKSVASNVILHSGLNNSKRDSVSFTGFSGARLANTEIVKTVSKAAKDFITQDGRKATMKAVSGLVGEVSDAIAKNEKPSNEFAQKFLEKNSDVMKNFVTESKNLILETKKNIDADKLIGEISKETRIAIESLPAVEKTAAKGGKSFYTNKGLEKIFNSANDNSAVFGAVYSAMLACLLRPATILAMPAKGSNKEDNRYSASHSIASGITGAVVAFAFNNPLASGIKEFAKNPGNYLKGEKLTKFENNFNSGKSVLNGISNRKFDTGVKSLNLGAEVLLGVPQALLTIALIPPILKKLGIQKSSAKKATTPAQQEVKADNAKQNNSQVSFKGNDGKKVSWVTKKVASGVSKVFNSEPFLKFVNKADVKDSKLVANLSMAKSALISGLYVGRTLSNKNLDSNRKTTLAINQASVWFVATFIGCKFNKFIDKAMDKFTNNYRAANVNRFMAEYGNNVADVEKHINRLNGGIKAAKALLIFSTVYRYLSPVLVTPIANKIGNFVEAKRNKAKAQVNADVAMKANETQQTQKSEKV